MTKKAPPRQPTALMARMSLPVAAGKACVTLTLTAVMMGCTTPAVAPPMIVVAAPVVVAAPAPTEPVAARFPQVPVTPEPIAPSKEPPPVELPEYAKRGKRLPANGDAPGRAVANYCRSFEIDKNAAAYFKTLTRTKRLPSVQDVAERSRQAGQPLTVQQVVERDWALRRESNKSAPQRCKVLGGSIDGATALIVFEAELNGRRQRGIATVLLADKKWRVRDHGDWVPAK